MLEEISLHNLILDLLEFDILKTTEQVVEEFKMEYPAQWKALEKEGKMLYGSSCSSVQQPSTRISQILLNMPSDVCMLIRKNNATYWRKCKTV